MGFPPPHADVVGRSSFMKQKVLSVTPWQATLRACVSDTCPTITTPTQHMHAGLCVRPRACRSGVRMRATLLVPRRSIACHRGWHAVLCRRVCTQGRGTNLAHNGLASGRCFECHMAREGGTAHPRGRHSKSARGPEATGGTHGGVAEPPVRSWRPRTPDEARPGAMHRIDPIAASWAQVRGVYYLQIMGLLHAVAITCARVTWTITWRSHYMPAEAVQNLLRACNGYVMTARNTLFERCM